MSREVAPFELVPVPRAPDAPTPIRYVGDQGALLQEHARRLGARSVDGYRWKGETYVRAVSRDWRVLWFRLVEQSR